MTQVTRQLLYENALADGLYRNAIINGNFDIWQRGTSFSSSGFSSYTADMFKVERNGTGTTTISQSTDVPSTSSIYSLKHVGDYAAGEVVDFKYRMEGVDAAKFSGKKITFQFQHKESTTAGSITITVYFNYASAVDDFSTIETAYSTSITPSSTWTNSVITTTLPSATTTSSYPISNGLEIIVRLKQNTTTGTITNYLDQWYFHIGEIPLTYQPRSFSEELFLCKRFYEKTFNLTTAPDNNIEPARAYDGYFPAVPNNSPFCKVVFSVAKKGIPTVTIYNPFGTTTNTVRQYATTTDWAVGVEAKEHSFNLKNLSGSTGPGAWCHFHYVAKYEL